MHNQQLRKSSRSTNGAAFDVACLGITLAVLVTLVFVLQANFTIWTLKFAGVNVMRLRSSNPIMDVISAPTQVDHLQYADVIIDSSSLPNASVFPRLRQIDFERCQLTKSGGQSLTRFQQLSSFVIIESSIEEGTFDRIGEMGELSVVSIYNCKIGRNVLESLSELARLDCLNLSKSQFADEDAAHLAEIPGLNTLLLSKSSITDAGIARIRDSVNIGFLNLAGTDVSDVGLQHISRWPSVTDLDIRGTRIGDASRQNIEAMPCLRRLYVADVNLSVECLRELLRNKRFESLDVFCSNTTYDQFRTLESVYPEVRCSIDRRLDPVN